MTGKTPVWPVKNVDTTNWLTMKKFRMRSGSEMEMKANQMWS